MRDFKKYDVWKLSHELTLKVYDITQQFSENEMYGVSSQIRRASASISTNIAEGCGRESEAEFKRFLTIAQGSASEVEYLFILCKELNYINLSLFEELNKSINTIKRKIYSLKQKLN